MSIEVMRQALEYVQEFKRRWWAVPPFGNKVNKATREAVSAAHSPIFQIEDALRAAIEQAEKPVAWMCSDESLVHKGYSRFSRNCEGDWNIPVYTTPPTAPLQEHYDQTSLELCEECGWKAIIPGDGCLVCARQKAKPVAHVAEVHMSRYTLEWTNGPTPEGTPLYTAPRQWVGLTDEERAALLEQATYMDEEDCEHLLMLAEAKLKEKNAP